MYQAIEVVYRAGKIVPVEPVQSKVPPIVKTKKAKN